uniref:VOC domain-containing protein n=1 Tax=Aplanochytrium stocchinoi TaxID=215587 RepID=A0A7S3LHE7_9STRA
MCQLLKDVSVFSFMQFRDTIKQVHVNLGLCQFHLPFLYNIVPGERVEISQVWPGLIELITSEDVQVMKSRLLEQNVATSVCIRQAGNETIGRDDMLLVKGPFGNSFMITQTPDAGLINLVRRAGGHAESEKGPGNLLCIRSLTHMIEIGNSAVIANFYRSVMGFEVDEVMHEHSDAETCDNDDNDKEKDAFNSSSKRERKSVEVKFGGSVHGLPEQKLVFVESEHAPPANAYDTEEACTYHIAIYCSSHQHFEEVFHRANQLGLLFINKRFEGGPIEFASADTLELARAAGQFRIKNLIGLDPEAGKNETQSSSSSSGLRLGLVLEHEIRSPRHKCCPIRKARNN